MTNQQKESFVCSLLGEPETAELKKTIAVYLELAKAKMLQRRFPFVEDLENYELPEKYDVLHAEYALRLYARRGGEGEVGHTENGITRSYSSVNDEDILSQITPLAKVL